MTRDLSRISELFQQGVAIPAGPLRDAWLQRIDETEPDVGPRLRRLLAAHEAVEARGTESGVPGGTPLGPGALSLLRWAGSGSGDAGQEDPTLGPEPGATVGRYEVIGPLGRGGMGTVFLAHDPVLDRRVALKFLPSFLYDPDRLIEEARAASALDHPCIGTVHEVGEDDQGRRFIAMAAYEGGSLRDRLRAGPLPPAEATRIAKQAADALDAAHAGGIVHRDIKPENLVFDADGRVKIVDFGIAQGVHREDRSGTTGGTVAYMSPEQLDGGPVDGRSDLWSLGVVLFEMLTGRRPFEGADRAGVVDAIREGSFPRASALRPELDGEVDEVLNDLFQVDPEARIPTGKALADRLHEATRPAPALVELLRSRRGRGLRWAVAAGAVLLFGGGMLVAWQAPRVVEARGSAEGRFPATSEIVVADFQAPPELEELALAAREALVIDLQQSGFVRVPRRTRVDALLELGGRAPGTPVRGEVALEVAARAGAAAVLEVTVARAGTRYVLAGTAISTGGGDELFSVRVAAGERGLLGGVERLSREVRRRFGEAASTLAESRPLPEVTTASIEALRLYAEAERTHGSDPEEAGRFLDAALAIDPEFAMAHRLAAVARGNSMNYAMAAEHTRLASRHRERLTDLERWHIEAIEASEVRFDPMEGMRIYDRILTRFPEDFRAHWNRGNVRISWLADWEGAREDFANAIERNDDLGAFFITAGLTSLALGFDDEARELSRRAVAAGFEEHGRRWEVAHAFAQGDLAAVEALCGALLQVPGVTPLPVGDDEYCGSIFLALGRVDAALSMLEGAHTRARAEGRLRNVAHAGQALAVAELLRGEPGAARARLEVTVDAIPVEGFQDPDRFLTRVNLATQAALLGWPDLARRIRDRFPPHPEPDHWFSKGGEALVDAALALSREDGPAALAALEGAFPEGVMPMGWATFDIMIRARGHELAGDAEQARYWYARAAARPWAVKAVLTKDRMHVPLAEAGLARLGAEG